MILYFSGTGNSEYIAKIIADEIEDVAIDLFKKIRDHDYSEIVSQTPWIIVTPTYAWRIPRIVEEWIKKTVFNGNQDVYFVMTCGGAIGNAQKYLQKLCAKKNMNYKGCAEIVMPENYIALFNTPQPDEIQPIIEQAQKKTLEIIKYIKQGNIIPSPQITIKDKLNSGIVNDVFYPLFVHDKKFYVTDKCISCGKCVSVCPLKNIKLKESKPIWNHHCTHCMACISRCPTEAIEYGKNSIHKLRYTCPK